ncbi:hypothetical protein ACFZB6_08505 [Streptomyces syringium]|uniref:hypothetical protein n=1 Tax=Streptomyces syringium TaxID=76729 RepID=UPI0033EE1F0E
MTQVISVPHHVISLPHSSGPGSVIVGKTVDRCAKCQRWTAARRRAGEAQDWAAEKAARILMHRHWLTHRA